MGKKFPTGISKNKHQTSSINNVSAIQGVDRVLLWVLLLAIGLVPIIVRGTVLFYYAPLFLTPLLDSGLQGDVFAYKKLIFLIILAVLALGLLTYKVANRLNEIRPFYINIPLLLIFLLTLLSCLVADPKYVSLMGAIHLHEGTLALICYYILFFAAANLAFTDNLRKYLTCALGLVVIVNAVLAIYWFFGGNMLNNSLVRALVVPEQLASVVAGTLPTTFSNINYLSGFSAIALSYFLVLALLSSDIKSRIINLAFSLLAVAMTFASMSSSGFLTIIALSPIIIILGLKYGSLKNVALTLGSFMVIAVIIFIGLNNYNPAVYSETFGAISEQYGYLTPALPDTSQPKVLQADDDRKTVETMTKIVIPEPAWTAGTGRLYLWKKTLKLIEERPFLGYGPNTLAYYFPQNDIDKVSNLGAYETWVDKPHNMYIATAFNSGIPVLICFLVLIGLHFYKTVRRLWENSFGDATALSAALFAAWLAFLIQYLFNDSTIGVSVIFWVLFGISVSLNYQLLGESKAVGVKSH
ncbi:MAG: O-antigen ligase family protein [Acidobacteriota bacterium]